MSTTVGVPPTSLSPALELTCNLAQNAGTYTAGTVSGGDIMVEKIVPFVSVAATGLTSVTVQSNNTTADTILASTLLASLTAGKNLTAVSLPFVIPSGKLITYTIVGNGSAGTLLLAMTYRPLVAGAQIA